MDEHLPDVSMRRDGRSFPTSEYSQTARRTTEYRLVGGGTAECRQPADGLARGGAGGDRETRGVRGGLATRVRVFSRQQSGPVPAFLSSGVPECAPGGRGWSGLAGWMKAQIRGKTRNRGRDWAVFRRSDEKRAAGGLVGFMAGDALRRRRQVSDALKTLLHMPLCGHVRGTLFLQSSTHNACEPGDSCFTTATSASRGSRIGGLHSWWCYLSTEL
jgi:hypothetical protein